MTEYIFNKNYDTMILLQEMATLSFYSKIAQIRREGLEIKIETHEPLSSSEYSALWLFIEHFNQSLAEDRLKIKEGVRYRMNYGNEIILLFRTLCIERGMDAFATISVLKSFAEIKEMLSLGLLESALYLVYHLPDDSFLNAEYQPGVSTKQAFVGLIQKGIILSKQI